MTADHPDLAYELEGAGGSSLTGTARPEDVRYVDPGRPRRTPVQQAAVREQEIADGSARIAKQQRAEQDRTDRALAQQAERLAAGHRDGAGT